MLNRIRKNLGGPRTVPANISGSRVFASGWSATGLAIMVACAFGSFVASGGGTTGIILAAIFLAAAPIFAAFMGVVGNYVGRWRDNVAAAELADFQKTKSIEEEAKQVCQMELEKAQYLAEYFAPHLQAMLGDKPLTQQTIFKLIDREVGKLPNDGKLYALIFKRAYLQFADVFSQMHNSLIEENMRPLKKAKLQRTIAAITAGSRESLDVENGLVYRQLHDEMKDLSLNEQLALISDTASSIFADVQEEQSLGAQFRHYFYDRDLSWLERHLSIHDEESQFLLAEQVRASELSNSIALSTSARSAIDKLQPSSMLFQPEKRNEDQKDKSKKRKEVEGSHGLKKGN